MKEIKKLKLLLLLLFILVLVACNGGTGKVVPGNQWEMASPKSQGMDGKTLQGIEESLPFASSVLIVRNGYMVYEFHQNKEQKLPIYSCTKSITSTLIGIAIDKGYIQGVDQKVADFFPEWADRELDNRWREMTIQNLLTMTSGLQWPRAYERRHTFEDNWLEFIFAQSFEAEPGEAFNYNSGVSHLLSAIVQRATGMSTEQFAITYLFEPIGINDFTWEKDPQGISAGGLGIEMAASDLARFGLLFLNKGMWGDTKVVSEQWVNEATDSRIGTPLYSWGYGYQWWISSADLDGEIIDFYFAQGFLGQFIFVVPEFDLVAVFTSLGQDNAILGHDVFVSKVLRAVR